MDLRLVSNQINTVGNYYFLTNPLLIEGARIVEDISALNDVYVNLYQNGKVAPQILIDLKKVIVRLSEYGIAIQKGKLVRNARYYETLRICGEELIQIAQYLQSTLPPSPEPHP